MDSDEIARAARDRDLGAVLAAFPEDVAAAIVLARVQRDALAAMPFEPTDAA